MGAPGCPERADSTWSMDKKRIVLTDNSSSVDIELDNHPPISPQTCGL
tara:strand:- start:2284 stop:2427 length:144 start_codon:yes stop_codon:yes gene_type:complete